MVSSAMTAPDIFTLSGCNAHTLSASLGDGLSIELPYFIPMEWVDGLSGSLTPDGKIATVWLAELNRLLTTSPNISASIPIVVYASFTEIEMMGMCSFSKEPGVIKELQKKNNDGINAKTVVSGVSQVVRALPVIGPIWGAIATIINTFAGDLAKPVNDAAPQLITATATPDSALCHGITQADEVSMYSQALVSQSKTFNGMLTSHITLNELARKPMLHLQYKFDGTNTSFALTATPQIKDYSDFRNMDWLWAISLAFRYWKGSIKYLIHFVLPSFQSFRAQITILDQLGVAVVSTGDLMNKIVNVQGETWVEVNVPYLRPVLWVVPAAEVPASAAVPKLVITQLTPIVGSSLPATPVCYINVYRAGGEDTAFRVLQHADDLISPEKEVVSQSLEVRFRKPFDGLVAGSNQSIEKGYVAPEIACSVSDCLKRASFTLSSSSTFSDTTAPFNFPPGTGNVNYGSIGLEPFQYFAAMFMFWRGSRIIRHYQTATIWGVQDRNKSLNWGDGAALHFPAGSAGTTFREALSVDYRSIYPYIPVFQPGIIIDYNSMVTVSMGPTVLPPFAEPVNSATIGGLTNISIAGGDDFMLIHPVPFFPVKFYPAITPEQQRVEAKMSIDKKPSSKQY